MAGLKTKAAFTFTMKTIAENMKCRDLFLWTFTFKDVHDVGEAIKRWGRFLNEPRSGLTVSFPKMSGIRVFEMHPGTEGRSHGLHIHMVTDAFLPVDIVRAKWFRFGSDGGRIHVKAIEPKAAHYVGKYLTKERAQCLKGVRLWQSIGACNNTRVSDIVIQSEFTDAYKFLASAVQGFQKLSYGTRAVIVRRFVSGESIEEAMRACQITQDYWQQVKAENEYFASLNDPWEALEEESP